MPSIYEEVIFLEYRPGAISQDMVTVVAAGVILLLSFRIRERDSRRQIVVLALLAYLFYGYGVYSIDRTYNFLYFNYLALFGLSFYSITYGISSIDDSARREARLSRRLRITSVVFSLLIVIFFSSLWVSRLISLIQQAQKPEFAYSVFILDLSFIMPAFVILAVMVARNQGLGLLLTPGIYLLGFIVLLPVGLGEFLKPRYGLQVEPGGVLLYLGTSLPFLILSVIYFKKLKMVRE